MLRSKLLLWLELCVFVVPTALYVLFGLLALGPNQIRFLVSGAEGEEYSLIVLALLVGGTLGLCAFGSIAHYVLSDGRRYWFNRNTVLLFGTIGLLVLLGLVGIAFLLSSEPVIVAWTIALIVVVIHYVSMARRLGSE